ncbi:MAG: BTAD domain-containing putative transcriptional regulator [Longimicrobiales bacterium]
MLLRTFGGLSIEAESGAGLTPSLGPRRLALLAVVAAAGRHGITRERILGILWPDADEESARHTLSQTLYSIRRDTGRECIIGSAQLRLADSITSDVQQFHEALKADQLARAVSLYHGPFLDGFYLPGAPEFERWVEETRSRLQFQVRKALESLASRAFESGAHASASEWWRRLCEIDPLNTTYALGRIRTLVTLGDTAAALRLAREYESRVQRELEADVDPAVRSLINELRVQPAASNAPLQVAAPVVTPAAILTTTTATSRWRRRVWMALIVAGAGLASAVLVRGMRQPDVPFLAIGSIQVRDSAALEGVLRDMLSTNLARIEGIQVVANSRLIELLPRRGGAAPGATADAARRAGASEIIEGELGLGANGWLLTLRRVALRSGAVQQGYSAQAADLFALTDSATAAIAHDFGLEPPHNAVAAVRTSSASAYAIYEEGLRALYGGDPHSAIRLMKAALEHDSTFAMAAYFGWMASNIAGRYEELSQLLPLARRLAARTTDRERLLIESTLAREDRPVAEFLAIARELTSRFPQDPDGQIELGWALAAQGDWAGSVAALNRAIAIDSISGATGGVYCRVCGAIGALGYAYTWWDSAAAAERSARRLLVFRPAEGAGWAAMMEALLRQGRRADAEAALARVAKLSLVSNIDFTPMLDRDLIRSGRSDELEIRLLSELRDAAPHERGQGPWLLAFALRNQGRLRAALELATAGTLPGNAGQFAGHHDVITEAVIALERGQPRAAARQFLALADGYRTRPMGIGSRSRGLSWHLTLAGTALAAAGDSAALRPLADSVERIGASSSFGRDHNLHFFLRGLLLQLQNRHADAVDAFRRSLFSTSDGYTRINLELSRSLNILRRHTEAIPFLQAALRGGVDGSNTYVTHTELHEALAQTFDAAGQRDSALVHYIAVEKAWRRSDPEFAERYNRAKSRLTPVR